MPGAPSLPTASSVPLGFPVATTIEWSAQAFGDGVLMFASDFPDPAMLPGQREHAVQPTVLSMPGSSVVVEAVEHPHLSGRRTRRPPRRRMWQALSGPAQ